MGITRFTRVCGLALASLVCASGALAAEGVISNADGTLKVSNTTPKVGETVTVSFSTTAIHNKLHSCSFQVIVRSPDPGNSYLKYGPLSQGMISTDPPQVSSYTLTQPGNYRALAINPTAFPGACGSLPQGIIISSPLQIDFSIAAPLTVSGNHNLNQNITQLQGLGVSAPGTCPDGYDRLTQGVDTSKGEFYCLKKWQACPAGYTQTVNDNTGQIVCTPTAPPTCPTGWTGGLADGGKLVCNPIAQPVIACGDSPLKSQGYYLQYFKYQNPDWNRMGCMALEQTK